MLDILEIYFAEKELDKGRVYSRADSKATFLKVYNLCTLSLSLSLSFPFFKI